MASSAVMKIEAEVETCAICGSEGNGELLTPEEHDSGAAPMQVPLRAMLLHLNNNKVVPEGRLCVNCIRRTVEAYEFSVTLSAKGTPPLSEKIRALRRRLHELTQKIDVFIVVGSPGANAGGTYSEEDIIMVDKDAIAVAAAADDEDMERVRNARGESVYQCTVCPLSFQRVSELRAHAATHGPDAAHSCWTCGAQFAGRAQLRAHAADHAPPAALTCYLCDTTFQSAGEHRRHVSVCAGGGVCPVAACGAAAGTRAALAAHAAHAHGAGARAPHLCAACFRQLPTRAALAAHALAHRAADKYVCGYGGCILRFATRSTLVAHIRAAHAGSPPAPPAPAAPLCTVCSRTFGSAAALKRHARVHAAHQEDEEWQAEGEEVEYLEMEALEEGERAGLLAAR